jgi:hypothetical protein
MKKINYSSDEDILTVELNDLPIDYAEESGDLIIHFSSDGIPVLLEVLSAKQLSFGMLDSIMNNREVII